jgi:hypothetical protein
MRRKEKFGIFTPVLGLKQDFPVILLPQAYFPDNQNIYIRNYEIHRIDGSEDTLLSGGNKVKTPDTNPIIHYHLFQKANGDEYLVVFTKKHVYYWDTSSSAFSDAIFTCDSDVTHWSTVTYNNLLIATNNSDLVQKWEGTGSFANLDTASGLQFGSTSYVTKAKYVAAYENYLIFGWVHEKVGETTTEYPSKIRWSDLGSESDWDSGDAGANFIKLSGFITGFGEYQGFLFVFFKDSIYRMWLTSTTDIWNNLCVSKHIGCLAPDSIVNDQDGGLYFFASDYTFRHITRGEISKNIEPTCRQIKPSLVDLIRGIYVDEYGQIWWSIPSGLDATGNNEIVAFVPSMSEDEIWIRHDLEVDAFGNYLTESDQKFLRDLGSDGDGYTYLLHSDENSTQTGYFVLSTDLAEQKNISTYKRLLDIHLYLNNGTYLTGSTVDDDSASGQKVLKVASTDSFSVGDKVVVNRDGNREEVGDINSIQAGVSITLENDLTYTHTAIQADDVEMIGKVTVSIKCNNEKEWNEIDSVYLYDLDNDITIKHLPVDYRGETFLIKVSGNNHFECLGLLFEYLNIGGR